MTLSVIVCTDVLQELCEILSIEWKSIRCAKMKVLGFLLLSLFVAEVQGCEQGYAGTNCSYQCPDNCFLPPNNNSDTCNANTGRCMFGCLPGYAGDNCSRICPEHCFQPQNDGNYTCDAVTGTCIYGCKEGFADYDCSFECPQNCTLPLDGGKQTCNSTDGSCLNGCKYGSSGTDCTVTCPEHCGETFETFKETCDANTSNCLHGCKEGYAGSNCSVKCPPKCKALTSDPNDPVCDEHSGNCRFGCQDGFFGDDCSKLCNRTIPYCDACIKLNASTLNCTRCVVNYYTNNGVCNSCSYWCSHVQLPFCNPTNGNCWHGCKPRKMGALCDLNCPFQCKDGCGQYSGFCTNGCYPLSYNCGPSCMTPCSSGCVDHACEHNCTCTKGCRNNMWGLRCEQICNTNCASPSDNISAVCDLFDGQCNNGCLEQKWWGKQCTSKCSDGCKGDVCNQETGHCLDGCNKHLFGLSCDRSCSSNCFERTCRQTDGYCEKGCTAGWYRNSCDLQCSPNCLGNICERSDGTCTCKSGWYGKTCGLKCPSTCVNTSHVCDSLSGNCSFGCISGYQGDKCENALGMTDFINVNCDGSRWDINIDMQLLTKLYPSAKASDIYLGENTCNGLESWNRLTFTQALRKCGTSKTIQSNAVVYSNELIYAEHDLLHPFIIRHYNWTIGVECDVQRNETSSGQLYHDSNIQTAAHLQVTSHYTINMTFYQDANYNDQITGYHLQVPVGTNVYVKVFSTSADWTIKLRVHTCYTKPSPSSPEHMKYYLIKNGCEKDINTQVISQSSNETRFVFQVFEFISNPEGIYVYCDVVFCEASDVSKQCLQSCNPVVKRSVARP